MKDTRDLMEERNDLKERIFNDFIEQFPQYEEMTESFEDIRLDEEELESWRDCWHTELEVIEEIDNVENEVGSEFEYGVTLIPEDDFEEYCQEFVEDCYSLSEIPQFIRNNIDWEGIAKDMKYDYSEVIFGGESYLFRQ